MRLWKWFSFSRNKKINEIISRDKAKNTPNAGIRNVLLFDVYQTMKIGLNHFDWNHLGQTHRKILCFCVLFAFVWIKCYWLLADETVVERRQKEKHRKKKTKIYSNPKRFSVWRSFYKQYNLIKYYRIRVAPGTYRIESILPAYFRWNLQSDLENLFESTWITDYLPFLRTNKQDACIIRMELSLKA